MPDDHETGDGHNHGAGNDSGISQATTSSVGNVSVLYARLPVPQMSNTNIEAWFTTMDFWFTASGIVADKQKTATVLAALDPNTVSQLADVIANMPLTERYDYIRRKITEHFADSEQRRLNRLLSELPLGDKRPSELYFEMRRVAGNTLGEAALKGLWTKRLPDFVQPVIAASTGTPAEFTKITDSVVDAMSPNQINHVQASSSELADLRLAVVELGKKFEKLSCRSRSNSRRPTVRRNRSRSRSSHQNNGSSEECWYHRKYGRNALKCRSPCSHARQQMNAVSAASRSDE
ncbi:uncharacterized protein LOC142229322 [Haematobia irritans]|uniref:uncharacterized protein LOC142229322 n=1 Tax=Haematobia irritans TaxID=7368 RepID=UPI003F50B178